MRTKLPEYDDKCYLCPGNGRMGGEVNPQYEETYVSVFGDWGVVVGLRWVGNGCVGEDALLTV